MRQAEKHVRNSPNQERASETGGTTPVPNDIFDRVMPTLRDTELRVLLIVVRQTVGWQAGPGSSQRKDRDWLSQSQLRRRTGRANGAVSRAVEALVKKGLVHVTDRAGKSMNTPVERRRHLGHLYFQVGTSVGAVDNLGGSLDNSPKSEYAKGYTTKETVIQKYSREKENVDNSQTTRVGCWSRISAGTTASQVE